MAGVRVRHPTARNVRYTVVEPIPYPVPYVCSAPEYGGCGTTHSFKTHHLQIDETGAVIINDVLFEKLQTLLVRDGFTVSNVVKKPPAVSIGTRNGQGPWEGIEIVQSPNAKEP